MSSGVADGSVPSWDSSGRGAVRARARGRGRYMPSARGATPGTTAPGPFDSSNTLEG